MLLLSLFVLASSSLVGCEDDSDSLSDPGNLSQDYTLRGYVRALPGGEIIPGAALRVEFEDATATSAPDGAFELGPLRPGQHVVHVEAAGHVPSRIRFDTRVPEKRRDTALQSDIMLYPGGGVAEIRLVYDRDETPIQGVGVEWMAPEFPGTALEHALDLPASSLRGVTSADGTCRFEDLPATTLQVLIHAHDGDGDGLAEYPGSSLELALLPDSVLTPTVRLGRSDDVVQLVDANITPLGTPTSSVLGDRIWLQFSVPMSTLSSTTSVSVVSKIYPYADIEHSEVWTSPYRLEIRPDPEVMASGLQTSLRILAISERRVPFLYEASTITWRPYDTGPIPGDCDVEVTDLRRTQPVLVDADTRRIDLAWTAVPCAKGYYVYGRVPSQGIGWELLVENQDDFETGTIEQRLTLPAGFDRYLGDLRFLPFAGQSIEFAIVPKEAVAPHPDDGHTTIVIADEVAPEITQGIQYTTRIDTDGSPLELEYYVEFSEYLSETLSDPSVEIVEAGGDPEYALSASAMRWEWLEGRFAGRARFVVEPGTDPCGDEMRLVFPQLTDLQGNVADGVAVSPWRTVLCGEYVFDFDEGPDVWAAGSGSWEWGTPTVVGPASGFTSPNCWGVDLDSNYADSEESELRSPEIIVPQASTELEFYYWLAVGSGPDVFSVQVERPGRNNVVLLSRSASQPVWTQARFPLDEFAGDRIRLLVRFTATSYGTAAGAYLDDVSIRFVDEATKP